MLGYSKPYFKNLTFFVSAAMLASLFVSDARGQEKAGEIISTVNEILATDAPTPPEGTLKSVEKSVDENTEKQNKPVPMLETGDYDFDSEGEENSARKARANVSDIPSDKSSKKDNPVSEYDLGEDAFYDTEAILPKGRVGRAGPAPVDPRENPATRLMIVENVSPKNNKSAQLVSAERAMALGRYDSALQLYDELYEKNKKDSAVMMGRSVCLQKLGRFDEAMQSYEELAVLQPKNVEVKINMLGLLATRYPSVALRRLMDLQDANPQNVGLVAQIAVTAANLGDFDTAMRYLGMAMGMQPENASHIFNAAVILDRAGKTKDAVSYYEKALEVDSIYGSSRSIPRDTIYERLANIR